MKQYLAIGLTLGLITFGSACVKMLPSTSCTKNENGTRISADFDKNESLQSLLEKYIDKKMMGLISSRKEINLIDFESNGEVEWIFEYNQGRFFMIPFETGKLYLRGDKGTEERFKKADKRLYDYLNEN